MIQNNLDAEVAENCSIWWCTAASVVRRATGRADAILATLKNLNEDETLLVQSGKPVGVQNPCRCAARAWRTRTSCRNGRIGNILTNWIAKGLFMYGQMTAGSWIYIGSQGIVQGTYETFVEAGRQHFGSDWTGR